MATKRWNLSVEPAIIDLARKNAEEDGLLQADYITRLIRMDSLARRLDSAGLDDPIRVRLQKELESLL